MDISFHPSPDPNERRSLRAMVPWHRKALAWLADFHKFAITVASIAATTIAVHVWLKGLIARKELDVAVEAAVTKATAEIRGDLAIIKTNTNGIPAWRGDTSDKLIALDSKATAAVKDATKANDRIDAYLINARGHR